MDKIVGHIAPVDERDYMAATSNENLQGKAKSAKVAFQIVNLNDYYRVSYSNLDECTYNRQEGLLTIITGTRTYVLEGERLETIWEMFCRDEVLRLTVFNPDKHHAPETDAPIITRVTI